MYQNIHFFVSSSVTVSTARKEKVEKNWLVFVVVVAVAETKRTQALSF